MTILKILIYGAAFVDQPPRWVQLLARWYAARTGDVVAQMLANATPALLADAATTARNHIRWRLNLEFRSDRGDRGANYGLTDEQMEALENLL